MVAPAFGPVGTIRDLEEQADAILRDMAVREHRSLRTYGVIDERRQKTIRQREASFSDFFATRRSRFGDE